MGVNKLYTNLINGWAIVHNGMGVVTTWKVLHMKDLWGSRGVGGTGGCSAG